MRQATVSTSASSAPPALVDLSTGLKQLRDANRDTPACPSGLLLTVIPASSSRPTTAFGGVCPGTSQARSSSNKLGMNWSAMQAGQRPQASDAKIPLRQGLFGYPVGSSVTV